MKAKIILLALLMTMRVAMAADQEQIAETDAEGLAEASNSQEAPPAAVPSDGPKMLSGMSILGNEEAPKALVIVPWKSSELGDDLSLNDSLDDRARPVDREVFMRELSYYSIRSGQ